MDTEKDIITTEVMSDWPVYKRNVREILTSLGAVEENGKISIDSNNPILDVYPHVYIDDGMGYGVDDSYVVEVETFEDDGETYVNIWRDKETIKNIEK